MNTAKKIIQSEVVVDVLKKYLFPKAFGRTRYKDDVCASDKKINKIHLLYISNNGLMDIFQAEILSNPYIYRL